MSPYAIPMHDIVQLYPCQQAYWPISTDVYVGHRYMQAQIFYNNEFRNAYTFNFTRNPVFVNLIDPANNQVLHTLTPGLRE